ncbi:MAG TPA: hypothetical protein VFL57_16535 [Bryobacteraceae bacterium]|nr:hypothetical protein [Bryobacteraceae bacterium]
MDWTVRRFQVYALGTGLLTLLLIAANFPLLDVPYYWDEIGQFIPASLDLYEHGALVPRTTLPNIHPPGLMAYLAGVWRLTGYSVRATRVAMLLIAGAALLACFLLAVELAKPWNAAPPFFVISILFCSPLFHAQAPLAHLDLPAMLFTTMALVAFIRDHPRAAALASTALVLTKETGILVPAVFGAWLFAEHRRREAAWFLLPAAALAAWVLWLWVATGNPFGNREFAEYNLLWPLHPVRLAGNLARRLWFLLVADFHWIGVICVAIALRRTEAFRGRAWAVSATLLGAHILLMSAVGGAMLERYLLPALAILYIAIAVAWREIRGRRIRTVVQMAMLFGMVGSYVFNPPYPFAFENNMAWTDFVMLQAAAAGYLQTHFPDARIASAWPFTDALRRPEFGYVARPLARQPLADFTRPSLVSLKAHPPDIFVLYLRTWDPPGSVLSLRPARDWLARWYGWRPDVKGGDIDAELGFRRLRRWDSRGQWIEVYARPGLKVPSGALERSGHR